MHDGDDIPADPIEIQGAARRRHSLAQYASDAFMLVVAMGVTGVFALIALKRNVKRWLSGEHEEADAEAD
jgi:hypothetical protein